jgi:hypothetical protein
LKLSVAFAAFVAMGIPACRGRSSGKPCLEQWSLLAVSKGAADEQSRARAFADCARERKLTYSLTLRHPGTAADLPVAELGKHAGAVEVRLTVEDGSQSEVLLWKASSASSVYPLLAE